MHLLMTFYTLKCEELVLVLPNIFLNTFKWIWKQIGMQKKKNNKTKEYPFVNVGKGIQEHLKLFKKILMEIIGHT